MFANKKKRILCPVGVCEDYNYIWFTVKYPNVLIRVDVRNYEIRRFIINQKCVTDVEGYRFLHVVGEKVVLVPSNSDYLSVFDKKLNTFYHIELQEFPRPKNEDYFVKVRFSSSFIFGECIYMLGGFYPAIAKLDLKTNGLTYYTKWVDDVDGITEHGDTCGHFGPGSIVKDGVAYVPIACANGLLKISLFDDAIETINLDSGFKGYFSLASSAGSNNIWASSRHEFDANSIICFDLKTNSINRFNLPDSKANTLYYLVEYGGLVYAFPDSGGHIYVIDDNMKTVRDAVEIESVLVDDLDGIEKAGYMCPHFVGPKLYVTTAHDCCRHIIDIRSCNEIDRIYSVRDTCDYELSRELVCESAQKGLVLFEKDVSVDEYINGFLY